MTTCRPIQLLLLTLIPALHACVNLRPELPDVSPAVPSQLPSPSVSPVEHAGELPPASPQRWREVFNEPGLTRLIEQALQHNRDLKQAALHVERARALYQVQEAQSLPQVDATLQGTRQQTSPAISGGRPVVPQQVRATLGVAAFELDFFGKLANLSEEAQQRYLATEFAQDTALLSLVAEVVSAQANWQAQHHKQRIAQLQVLSLERGVALTHKRFEVGSASALDVQVAQNNLETAKVSLIQAQRNLALAANALQLLVGPASLEEYAPVAGTPPGTQDSPSTQYYSALKISNPRWLALPAPLDSNVLLQRPDLLQAETLLRASNARIGAVRAAFFPSIRLVGEVGRASTSLNDLFDATRRTWLFTPSITLPLFDGGRNQANLQLAKVDQDLALNQYQKAVQVAFRETADALAELQSLESEWASRQALLEQTERTVLLSTARYQKGLDSLPILLETQRQALNAQVQAVDMQQRQRTNRALLFKVLGGR